MSRAPLWGMARPGRLSEALANRSSSPSCLLSSLPGPLLSLCGPLRPFRDTPVCLLSLLPLQFTQLPTQSSRNVFSRHSQLNLE